MPSFTFTSPDGKNYTVEGPEGATKEQAFQVLQQKLQSGDITPTVTPEPPKTKPPNALMRYLQTVKGGGEAALGMATGFAAKPISEIAGVTAAAKDYITGDTSGDAAGFKNEVQKKLTYEPKTQQGKDLLSLASIPGELVGQAGTAIGNLVRDPDKGNDTLQNAVANATTEAVNQSPNFLGAAGGKYFANKIPAKEAALTAEQARMSVRDGTLEAARKEGYVVPPSAAGAPSFLGNRIEGVAGKAALGQEANLRNQVVTDNIARREAGLNPDQPITEGNLEKAREVISQPYREVSAVSPIAATALEKLKETRQEAKAYWQHYDRSAEPASLKKAQSLDAKAEQYEKLIEFTAKRVGKGDLLARLKQARKELAKNYTVERALNVGSGSVDASVIGRILDKQGVKSMDGGLLTIGKFQQAFGRYARENSLPPTPGKGEGAAAAAAALSGHGLFAAGVPFLGGSARALMLSKLMQKPPKYNLSPLLTTMPTAAPAVGLGITSGLYGQQGQE